MIYAGDQWIQYPVKDLYDKAIMQMSIAAARDMYEKGQKQLEDFYTKYGDFMSPFAKDMERYQQMVGGVRDIVNNLYANGIDPLRSAEGRAMVAQAINSVNPAELAAMKANAKMGYAYQDALQKLRQAGKYSQAQEDFDMALTGTTPFSEFATSNGAGGFNSWDRSSPIQATTLRDLTKGSYEGRTARTLTKEDFANDPRLKGMAYDPRYEYSGYVDSDLMKVAPGASASLAADPRAAYFRDLARQKVIAMGLEPTANNVEAQFQRDIADANAWALIDPTRKADEYAKMDIQYKQQAALQAQEHKHKMDEIAEAGKYKTGNGETGDNSGSYANVVNDAASAVFEAQKLHTILQSPQTQREYNKIQSIKDPVKRDKENKKFEGELMKRWLVKKRPGEKQIFQRLMDVKAGEEGRKELNRILDSRATGGSLKFDNDFILGTNLEKDSNGWFDIRESGYRVLNSHQLMINILKNESGNGFTITDVNGKTYGVQDIVNALKSKGSSAENSLWSHEDNISENAEKIKPSTKNKKYIVAHDEFGQRKIYMKAKVKYGVPGVSWIASSTADDMWVELPMEQLPVGTPNVESAPFFYGSESTERKQQTNAATNQTYSDVRW